MKRVGAEPADGGIVGRGFPVVLAALAWFVAASAARGAGASVPVPGRSVVRTGIVSDLAIDGAGYFVIRSADGAPPSHSLTRYGGFRIDEDGCLRAADGGFVMGFAPETGVLAPISFRAAMLGRGNEPERFSQSWWVESSGEFFVGFTDGSREVVARIAVALPEGPERLRRISEWNFECAGCGPADLPPLRSPGEGRAGWVRPFELELPPPELKLGAFNRSTERQDGRVIPVPVPSGVCVFLDGPGGLIVRDHVTDREFATRGGLLKIDSDGWLVTMVDGHRVRGFTDTPFPAVRDLRIPLWDGDSTWRFEPTLIPETVRIDVHGVVEADMTDGGIVRLGRLKMGPVANSTGWMSRASVTENAGPTRIHSRRVDPRFLDEAALKALNQSARFARKPIRSDESPTSLAILGAGFFVVRDSAGELLLTRSGRFRRLEDGSLANENGWRVQGVRGAWGNRLEDLRMAPSSVAAPPAAAATILSDTGEESVDGDLDDAWIDRIAVAPVLDPGELVEVVPHHYRLVRSNGTSGELRWTVSGWNGMGFVLSGAIEMLGEWEAPFPSGLPSRARQVVLWGLQGRVGRIQVSGNLSDWSDWLMFQDTGDALRFVPAVGGHEGHLITVGNQVIEAGMPGGEIGGESRFYRIVVDVEDAGRVSTKNAIAGSGEFH